MRRIAIIGAGQAGLQLGLGLLRQGYAVTLTSARTPDEIEQGRVTSSQCLFGVSRAIERAAGLNLWDGRCPDIDGMSFHVAADDAGPFVEWRARLDAPAQSVDQRLKRSAWLRLFVAEGGDLRLERTGVEKLEEYARSHDLVIVATGKEGFGSLFEHDAERSPFSAPGRALALTYVHGMEPAGPYRVVSASFVPGVGEVFVVPALTLSGPCDILVFEGVPGGPMDCWQDEPAPAQHLARSLELLDRYFPWVAARCGRVDLTDGNGILTGGYTPQVRRPIGRLPSGAGVLGFGDTVVLNDPLTGQGANDACKAADLCLARIVERGERPFDEPWMQGTFDNYWDYVQWVTGWTNGMLLPHPPHIQRLLRAAVDVPGVAAGIVNGFNHPSSLFPWIADPEEAEAFIVAGGRASLAPR